MTRISARPAPVPAGPALRRTALAAALSLLLLLTGCVPQAEDRADGETAVPSTSAPSSARTTPTTTWPWR